MLANLWKNGIAISGEIYFKNKSLIFTSSSREKSDIKINIPLSDISTLEYDTILAANLFKINMFSGVNYTFTVIDRDKLRSEIKRHLVL